MLPVLDEDQLEALRQARREWDQVSAAPRVWRQALPVDPALGEYPKASEFRPARFTWLVPVAGRDGDLPPIETTSAAETPLRAAARAAQRVTRALIGPPLDVSAIAVERMRKLVALPVLSADALSSVAYGPQAMLVFLVLAGTAGWSYSLPVGGAIIFLMLAVGISYRQTIRAYPQGGGSYIVASQNLGRVPGLMAAAGLLIDYVMTVAVSISSGVAAITSAYAVGVFLAFTLSQTGMVVHWQHHRDQPHWRKSLVFNAAGATLSGIVFVIEGVTKFTSGAWVAIVLIGLIILGALRIRRYYDLAGQQLALRPEKAARAAPEGRRPGSPRPKPGGTTTSTPARRCTSGSAPPSSPATTSAPSSTTSPPRRWAAPGPSPTSCTAA